MKLLQSLKQRIFTKFKNAELTPPGELDIVKYPHPALGKISAHSPVFTDVTYENLVADQLEKLMMKFDGSKKMRWLGVGLAAPQVGINRRFFVMTPNKKQREGNVWRCFRPAMLGHGKEQTTDMEGCLSCPDAFLPVTRWRIIDVQYYDRDRKLVTTTLKGWEARIFQHELDHLNGILCTKKK